METDYYLYESEGPKTAFTLKLALRDSHIRGADGKLLEALADRARVNSDMTEAICRVGYFQLALDTGLHEETMRKSAQTLEKPGEFEILPPRMKQRKAKGNASAQPATSAITRKRDRLLIRKRTMNGANRWRINAAEIWKLARLAHEEDAELIAIHRAETPDGGDEEEGFGGCASTIDAEGKVELKEQVEQSYTGDTPSLEEIAPAPATAPARLYVRKSGNTVEVVNA